MFHLLAVPPGRYILSVAGVNGFDDYETQIQIGQKTPPMIKVVLTLASVEQQTNVDSGRIPPRRILPPIEIRL